MKAYLKIKVVSLAAEAKLIRREESKMKRRRSERARDAFIGLRQHRINVVRPEARAACLAYAFLRGRPYRQVERVSYSLPDWTKVAKLVERYGDGDRRDLARSFEAWKDEALIRFAEAA